MPVKTLDELFEHELKDIYYAEHRLVEALAELAEESKSREIKRAYTAHRKETQGQIKRLQKVFRLFGTVPEVEKCPGIEGLLKEKHSFTKKEKPSSEILEYFNLVAAAKCERYEITAYESLIEMAQQLGMEQGVELLSENLQEEQNALDTVRTMAHDYDTAGLMPQEEDEEKESPAASKKGGVASKKSGAASKKSDATERGNGMVPKKSGAATGKAPAKANAQSDERATAGKSTARSGVAKNAGSRGSARGNAGRDGVSSPKATARNTSSGPAANDAGNQEERMIQTDPATAV